MHWKDLGMFNLMVKYTAWENGHDFFHISRVFEFTDNGVVNLFNPSNSVDLDRLMKLPTLFVEETSGQGNQIAKVGYIHRARINHDEIHFDFSFDEMVPVISNKRLEDIKSELDIESFEFTRTHWAVKNIDLFKALLINARPIRQSPKVFSLPQHEKVDPNLVSVMMPFGMTFDLVYESLKAASGNSGFLCKRADDIWEHSAVIQDIVSLIDGSTVVIADCTQRNPNVFYEIGIAHTLGREVILITQNKDDIPFDVTHLRYIHYLNNSEGLDKLSTQISAKLNSIAR